MLNKLFKPDADDRVILWCKICPTKSNFRDSSYEMCKASGISAIDEDYLRRYIRSQNDVENPNDQLRSLQLIDRLKVYFLTIQLSNPNDGDEVGILKSLGTIDEQMKKATHKLGIMADPALGGIDMPIYYQAIKDWIVSKQKDPNSVYSCR